MKKKVFSLMMMLLLAATGFVRADELTVHDGTATNSYVPVYGFYADAYLKCEMVYPASELSAMNGGQISSMAFGISSPADEAWTGTFQVFVKEVSDATISDFTGTTGATTVYTGTLDGTGSTMTVNFTAPYTYNGGNLLVGFYLTTTGNYKSITWAGETVNGASVQGYSYSSLSSVSPSQRNFLPKTTFTYSGGGGGGFADKLHVKYMDGADEIIDSLNLGVRPINAWTEPFAFQMYSEGPNYTVTVLDFTPSDGMFTAQGEELPFQVARNNDVDLTIGINATVEGLIERQFVAITEGDRAAHVWPIVVEMYTPAMPDVVEMPKEFTVTDGFSHVGVPATYTPTELHNDYDLPFDEIPEGYDAVYKLTFENDAMLNAYVSAGDNGKVALYREDFNGEGGPMAENYYVGPGIGGGSSAQPFEALIGDETSTSTTGYFPMYYLYNYSLSTQLYTAAELTEAGVTTAPMGSLSWYSESTYGYNVQNVSIWMANVADMTAPAMSPLANGMTLVYQGNFQEVVGWNEFVFNAGSFAWDGSSNILIMCQMNNGNWSSAIYWKSHNPGFQAMTYAYTDSAPYDAQTTSYSLYTSSTTRANTLFKSATRNQREATQIVIAMHDQYGDGWNGGSVTLSDGSNSQTFTIDDGYDATAMMNTSFGANVTVTWNEGSYDEECTFEIYSADGTQLFAQASQPYAGTLGSFTVPSALTNNAGFILVNMFDSYGDGWNGGAIEFNENGSFLQNVTLNDGSEGQGLVLVSGNSQITMNWIAGPYDDEVTFTVTYLDGTVIYSQMSEPSSGLLLTFTTPNFNSGGDTPTPAPVTPEGLAYGPEITNAAIEAGTYYLVASSTTPDFEVTINATDMPCPAIDAEGFVWGVTPENDEDEVEPASVTLRWNIPAYATGWRLVFGSTYWPEIGHPQTIIYPEDGGWATELANSYTVHNLWNNTNYFWRVEFNNGACTEGVSSPVFGFTTHLNIPQNLYAEDETIFNDEQVVLHWNAVQDRTYRYYNVYRDGEFIGHTDVNDINNTTYNDGPLAYNMNGYTYYVTAVYDEGESAPSNTVNVKVSGRGNVNGHVYEQDGTTGIANATVTMVGQDEFGVNHTYNFTTNGQGYYSGAVYAGSYNGSASCNGYQTIYEPVQGNPIGITYNVTTSPIDYILDENFDPVCGVIAEYYPDSLDPNSPYVKVYWGCGLPGSEIIEPFETGDFSMFDWQVDPTYPWSITTNNPYEGTYCMKSGGAGVANVVSNMTVTVNIPADGIMSFFGKISCESSWDYGYFYIDGVQKGSYTGAGNWAEKVFDITAGDHTFQWRYTKDGSVNSNDDCFYVDYITFYRQPEPAIPGMTYTFDDATMQGWTSVDADGDGYGWMVGSELMTGQAGHNGSADFVFSQSYNNSVGVLYPDNYLVSPQVQLGGVVRFYACAQDASYAAEHFGLAVSTTNTQPSSFTTVQEWTMSAKSVAAPAGKAVKNSRSGREQGNWYEYTVDLSAYSGMGYVAIRHFNCSDMFYLDVDDITIGEPGKGIAETRSLDHYRVYRTNCYQECPFTEDNTVLLATVWVPDTVYIDVEWADLPAGVYKWGVGAVYSGNRGELIEGPITWAEPQAVNMPEMSPELYAKTCCLAPQTEQGNVNPLPVVPGMTRGNFAYACNAYGGTNPEGWIKYDIDAPTAGTSLNSSVSVFGGDLAADGYVYATYNDNNWYKIDPLTGAVAASGSLGMFFVDCAYDYTTNTMFGSYGGNLYIWDLANNTTTLVGSMGVQSMQMMACDLNGQLYGIEYSTGNFDAIDKTTGAVTVIGSTGYSPAYVQGGGFDHNTGKLYWAGYTSTGIFCEINPATGAATLLGNNVGEQLSWCVPYTYNPGPTPGPGGDNCNQLALPRESETIWSNCLDKDMYLDHVSVNVLMNSADSPEGTEVTFTNLNEYEQMTYGGYDVTLDGSGYYLWDNFRRGDYAVKVAHVGYETINDTVSIWETTDLRYVMIEIIYGVENVYVSRTGWAMWDPLDPQAGGSGINPNPGPGGNYATSFTEDFEGGLSNWTIVDADGDGHVWNHSSQSQTYSCYDYTGWGHNGTNGFAYSQSYTDCTYDSYDPNNFMITNTKYSIVNGSTLNFWADYGNDSYPDHFGVAVATVDNPTPADFTMVWEGSAKAGNGKASVRHDENRYQNWRSHSVDLSAYAGQDVYIAFRHFNSYDQYEVYIDDVELTAGAKNGGDRHLEYYKVMCTSIDGVPIFNHNTVWPFCQLSTNEPYNAPLVEGEHYLCKVAVMYSTGMSAWSEPVEWVYEPCDHWGPVDAVEVNTTGEGNHIEWVFEHGFNPYGGDTPGPGPGPQPGENATVILTCGDVWGDGSGYQMLLDADANAFGTIIPETGALSTACSGNEAIYAEFEYKIPTNADGNCSTQNMVMNNSVSIEIPAGTYDWCITNPTPGDRIWIASAQGNVGGRQNDYTFEAGSTYEFTVTMQGSNDAVNVVITGGGKGGNAPLAAGEVKDIANVTPGNYGYIVRPAYSTSNMIGQNFNMVSETSLMFNIGDIANYDERVYFLYKLMNDSRFSVINGEQVGMFVVNGNADLNANFVDFIAQNISEFTNMDKYQAADMANAYKGEMPASMVNAMMTDLYVQSRENNMCEFADPFCTDNGMYEFPAGVNAGSGEAGPDYDCLYTQPNPAWYYMRIGDPGAMDIHMFSTPEVDIDFCCWGPFEDPTTPCPNGLTEDKVVSCSYSTSWTEHCMIPATAQTGEYYILVITNYSNQPCNINFSMVAGAGSTDCGILPPTDIIGFLITMDGEYLAFAEPTDRDFMHEGEFGDHEYCVRPIYPGEMTLPDHNYGWSMGCPVCFGDIQGCAAYMPIHGEAMEATDQVKVWWGDENPGPGPGGCEGDEFSINFDNSQMPAGWTTHDEDGDGYNWVLGTGCDGIYLDGGNLGGAGHNASADLICSGSYSNVVGPLTPDNWLISPTVTLCEGSAFSFWACGQDASYVAEHFGVAVSEDNGNSFTMVQEWTMTAKSGGDVMSIGRNGNTRAQGTWHQYTVDLSAYAGEGRKIALRHFNCTDMFILDVDDLELTNGAKRRADIVSFNVYRSTDNDNYAIIGTVPYVDGQTYYEYIDTPETAGTYFYQVTTVYANECESEPAMSFDNPANDYVEIGVTGIGENNDGVALFPNPTNGNVTIQAAGMSRITVVSVLGQMVYDVELNANEYTLNMGQFNAGLYMVRVYTANGMVVKRVTVMQ